MRPQTADRQNRRKDSHLRSLAKLSVGHGVRSDAYLIQAPFGALCNDSCPCVRYYHVFAGRTHSAYRIGYASRKADVNESITGRLARKGILQGPSKTKLDNQFL